MIKTTYQCDKCSAFVDHYDDLRIVMVVLAQTWSREREQVSREAHWCLKCCRRYSMFSRHLDSEEELAKRGADPKPPTLEDFIRELVREEVDDLGLRP